MPKNSNFRLPRGHRFFAKNGSYGYGAKSRWRHPGVHLGANGVPLGPRNGSKPLRNYYASKFEFLTTPRSTIFHKKWKLRLWRQITVGDPLGSILGPMASHWVQKMGQSHKKLPCPKSRIFDYPTYIDFSQKMEVTVMAPNYGGDPVGSILGPMGSRWVKKMGQKP